MSATRRHARGLVVTQTTETEANDPAAAKAKGSHLPRVGERSFVPWPDCVPERASHSSHMPPRTPPRRPLEDQLTTQVRRSHGSGECSDPSSEMLGEGRCTRFARVRARRGGRRARSTGTGLAQVRARPARSRLIVVRRRLAGVWRWSPLAEPRADVATGAVVPRDERGAVQAGPVGVQPDPQASVTDGRHALVRCRPWQRSSRSSTRGRGPSRESTTFSLRLGTTYERSTPLMVIRSPRISTTSMG